MTPLQMGPGEIAWKCDVVRVGRNGQVEALADPEEGMLEILERNAGRLYLDVVEDENAAAWLVHRAGWPFDLALADLDPIGCRLSRLRPVGAGDEVMRDLIEAFEAEAPGFSLHIHAERSA